MSPLHYASMNGHVEVVAKLIAANTDINLKNQVSTSLHVSEQFRLYEGLPIISAWNTSQMTRKGSCHCLTILWLKKIKLSCEQASIIINKYTPKARSIEVRPGEAIMRNLKGRVPCLVGRWQAQLIWIVFRFRCVIIGGNDLTSGFMYSQCSTGSRFFQLHESFLWYEWRRWEIVDRHWHNYYQYLHTDKLVPNMENGLQTYHDMTPSFERVDSVRLEEERSVEVWRRRRRWTGQEWRKTCII